MLVCCTFKYFVKNIYIGAYSKNAYNHVLSQRLQQQSYTWPDSVSICDTFLERGIVRACAGNNLMLTLYR
ncbi:hypothetical protein CHARACLAT_007594 [Characodon lateralis]|uniref:Uncharacterized protein n=1 Tax=Characodon lateralis TaxID=208331 RepID=A0ABU7DSC7_9TELE|nr:hypothetical protein [Characodon lateralis]